MARKTRRPGPSLEIPPLASFQLPMLPAMIEFPALAVISVCPSGRKKAEPDAWPGSPAIASSLGAPPAPGVRAPASAVQLIKAILALELGLANTAAPKAAPPPPPP